MSLFVCKSKKDEMCLLYWLEIPQSGDWVEDSRYNKVAADLSNPTLSIALSTSVLEWVASQTEQSDLVRRCTSTSSCKYIGKSQCRVLYV